MEKALFTAPTPPPLLPSPSSPPTTHHKHTQRYHNHSKYGLFHVVTVDMPLAILHTLLPGMANEYVCCSLLMEIMTLALLAHTSSYHNSLSLCLQVESEGVINPEEPPSGPTNPPRGRSRSRASSTSSVTSVGSKRSKKAAGNGRASPPKPAKKRRRFFSSDSDDDDTEYKM